MREQRASEGIYAIGRANLEPLVAKIVTADAHSYFHEYVLNTDLQFGITFESVLIVPDANIFGAASSLAFLPVSALAAHFISIAEVFFAQSVHGLVLLNCRGQVLIVSFIPGLHHLFRLFRSVARLVLANGGNDLVGVFCAIHPNAR